MKLFTYSIGWHYIEESNEIVVGLKVNESGAVITIVAPLSDSGIASVCSALESMEDLFLEQVMQSGMKHPAARRHIADAVIENLADAEDLHDVVEQVRKLRDEHPNAKGKK